MTKREQYLENSGLVKVAMMLVIVAFHSIANWGIPDWFLGRSKLIPAVVFLAEWMSSFHTSTFVFAAGFIFYSVQSIGNHYKSFLEFEKTKVKCLLVPYIFVSALWCIPCGIVLFNYSLHDILRKYILGISPAQLWFLLMLFGVYSIFFCINKLFSVTPKYIGLSVCGIYIVSMILRKYIPNVFMLWKTADMLPVFAAGYAFNKHIDRLNIKFVIAITAVLHLGAFTLYMGPFISNSILSELIQLVMYLCGASFMFTAVASLGVKYKMIKNSRLIIFWENDQCRFI